MLGLSWNNEECNASKQLNRKLHFIGIFIIILPVIIAIIINLYYLILIAFFAYGFAWFGHFFVEKNNPATFRYPLGLLTGDFKIFYLMCNKMDEEIV